MLVYLSCLVYHEIEMDYNSHRKSKLVYLSCLVYLEKVSFFFYLEIEMDYNFHRKKFSLHTSLKCFQFQEH